ncbi:hypothetical protein Ngar_c08870 [Candidatus Nitrososphaera gargensis Ga9.2]|uniref:Uncharacterized protein n=1 Tax=Nitrososphaera gargensis (strain Ga9.2) TaxID=1237085 RepID=K0IME0_NITGG|nr:hypothetical protein [Candidatus Nitrososphaera gargensis]AFU57829.1 hypothetical protein Ngar_c08870 [Candidatus Nitrososphaera gargensis Ga9.2]
MAKVRPSITLKLKSGQTITLDLQEVNDIIKSLTKFVNERQRRLRRRQNIKDATTAVVKRRIARNGRMMITTTRKAGRKIPAASSSMSQAKRQEILEHVNKKLSTEPKTLSNLLKGVSYSPNYLPAIRNIIENQPNIAKQIIGKRTYYRTITSKNGEKKHRVSSGQSASSNASSLSAAATS